MNHYIIILAIAFASQYAPGVMEGVVTRRQARGQLPQYTSHFDGFVASRYCNDLGEIVWLRPVGSYQFEMFLVTDCAGRSDTQSAIDPRSGYEWMMASNIIYEVDHQTAKRWHTVGYGIKIESAYISNRIGGLVP